LISLPLFGEGDFEPELDVKGERYGDLDMDLDGDLELEGDLEGDFDGDLERERFILKQMKIINLSKIVVNVSR